MNKEMGLQEKLGLQEGPVLLLPKPSSSLAAESERTLEILYNIQHQVLRAIYILDFFLFIFRNG